MSASPRGRWLGWLTGALLAICPGTARGQQKQEAPPRLDAALDILPQGASLRLGTTRLRHGSRIMGLTYSHNGRILAAGGGDDPVRLWDTDTGKEIRTLKENWVFALAFTPKDSVLATAGAFKTIRLWEVATGKEFKQLEGHAAAVKALLISPDGYTLASGGADGTILLWEFLTGKIITEFKGHTDEINGLAFSSDSNFLASASSDRTVRIWDCENAKHVRTIDGGCAVSAVAFGKSGKTVLSGGDDHLIRIWNMADGKLVQTLKGHEGSVVSLLTQTPKRLEGEPEPESKLVSSARDRTMRIWDLKTARELLVIARDLGDSDALAGTRNGKFLACAGANNTIRIFETAGGKEMFTGPGHQAGITSIAIAPNTKHLASAATSGAICLWDASSGKELRAWSSPEAGELVLAFSPDGRTVACGNGTDAVRFWDWSTGKEAMQLPGNPGEPLLCLTYAPDGGKLAVGRRQGTVELWDLGQKKIVQRFKVAGTAHALAFTDDGATLAVSGGGKIALFDVAAGKELHEFASRSDGIPATLPAVAALAFSPDGKFLAAGCYDAFIRILDTASGKVVRGLEGHGNVAYALAFSGDGRTLASASFDKTVRLWETFSGLQIAAYKGHEGPVTGLAFLKNGRGIFSGSADTSILLWDTTGLAANGKLPVLTLGQAELKTAWADLASEDAARGHRSLWQAVASAKNAVPFLEGQLYFLDPKKVDKLFTDLNSEQYKIRTDATKELEKYGIWMKGRLQALHKNPPTLEVQRRVEKMLDKLAVPGALTIEQERLRVRRVMLALEQLADSGALAVLRKMSTNAPEEELQSEAKVSLERLAKLRK